MQRRIVSLVPSLSETLHSFGLKQEIVGITQFCVRPPDLHRIAKVVGGTKDPDIDCIKSLNPTHIIANEEENQPAHIEQCKLIAPTLCTFPKGPRDVAAMVRAMSECLSLSGSSQVLASELISRVSAAIDKIDHLRDKVRRKRRFVYLIWKNPYMAVSKDTYISRCLEEFDFENCCAHEIRYPTLDIPQILALKPDIVFFSTEPYPFRVRDKDQFRSEWGQNEDIPALQKIDGQMLSWYGSETARLLEAMISNELVGEVDFGKPPFSSWKRV